VKYAGTLLKDIITYHERKLASALEMITDENIGIEQHVRDALTREADMHREYLRRMALVVAEEQDFPILRHLKRGSLYFEIGAAIVQTEHAILDSDVLTLYRGQDGQWFVRPPQEMTDGRFEPVDAVVRPLRTKALPPMSRPQGPSMIAAMEMLNDNDLRALVDGKLDMDEEVKVILKTGEDDDRNRTMPLEWLTRIVETRHLSITHDSDPDDEDMWGEFYVKDVIGHARPGPVTLHLKRI
jgi:hypothetical protein